MLNGRIIKNKEAIIMLSAEKQYLNIGRKIINSGTWIYNARTGKKCLTIPNATMRYSKTPPLLTTKSVAVNSAISEIIGYLRGYTSAADFRRIGTKTWDKNANETKAWLANPRRKGVDDMGKVYGAVAKDFGGVDLIHKVFSDIIAGKDDRGEIISFWNPSVFDEGCLRPCLMQHQFQIIGKKLYLTSYQRSCDFALGIPFNMVQSWFLLMFACHVSGFEFGAVEHHMVNVHLYEDQVDIFRDVQLKREPVKNVSTFKFTEKVKCFGDILKDDFVSKDYYVLNNYVNAGKIEYPFSE